MDKDDGYNYTEYAKKKWADDFSGNLASFYCREDFDNVLHKIAFASEDSVLFWENELEEMCKARGLDQLGITPKQIEADDSHSLLNQVPTREDLKDDLIQMLYENYAQHFSYSPEDYMTRIVRRLAPEYDKDPIRLAILKKFILGAGFSWKKRSSYRTEKVIDWAKKKFSDTESKAYEKYEKEKDSKKQLEMIVSKLDDSIFSAENLNSDNLTDKDLFLLYVRVLNNWIKGSDKAEPIQIAADREEAEANRNGKLTRNKVRLEPLVDLPLSPETRNALRNFCGGIDLAYKDSGNHVETLNKIADRMNCDTLTDHDMEDWMNTVFPLLDRDFKSFLKDTYCNAPEGKELKSLQKVYANYLKTAKDKKKDWQILQLCDNYAKGIFGNEGGSNKTRALLYYFAIMFGMTVRRSELEDPDPVRDLDKNLFRDYYNDNVLRYLKSDTSKETGKFEAEPRGDGINYKNYAEVLYLYFLVNDELGTAGERINQAERLITACAKQANLEKKWKESGKTKKENAREYYTEFSRTANFYEVLSKDKEDLLPYIVNHYAFSPPYEGENGKETLVPPLKHASEQVKASENMRWEARETPYFGNREPDNQMTLDKSEEEMNPLQEEWLREIPKVASKTLKEEWLWIIPNLLTEEEKYSDSTCAKGEKFRKIAKDETFREIVNSLNANLRLTKKDLANPAISRSKYLSAFLYYYIQKEKTEELDKKGRTFPDIYLHFLDAANEKLEEGRFQLFNSTNLVDLYVFVTYYLFLVRNNDTFDFESEEHRQRERERAGKQEEIAEQIPGESDR